MQPVDQSRQTGLAAWALTLRAQMASWHCDGMGHVNARHIASVFDDATAVYFAAYLGHDPQTSEKTGLGWADRSLHIDYLAEVKAGDVIAVESRIARLGAKSITLQHRMINVATDQLLGSAEVVTVCFDLKARTSREIPAAIRERHTLGGTEALLETQP